MRATLRCTRSVRVGAAAWSRILVLTSVAVLGLVQVSCGTTRGSDDKDAVVGLRDVDGGPFLDGAADVAPADSAVDGKPIPDAVGYDWVYDVAPGAFRAPCTSNDDCDSGWCVGWDEGYLCSQPCISDAGCPDDHWVCRQVLNTAPDYVFACFPSPSNLCRPCSTDFECNGGRCVDLGGTRACTRACIGTSDCPTGYACVNTESEESGAESLQCVPTSGMCGCSPANDKAERPCSAENETGRCYGVQVCDGDQGWLPCNAPEPGPEECNGRDDNCDGSADEDPIPPSEPCRIDVPDVGTCSGLWICRGSLGWECTARTPALETCDYRDNDCDGDTDEDFRGADGLYVEIEHCGACNASCVDTLPNATERCDTDGATPICVVDVCADGYFQANPFTCLPLRSSLCLQCASDASCQVPGDLCLPIGDGNYCGRSCAEGSIYGQDCPLGYVCEEVPEANEGAGAWQCVPESGSCECTPEQAGASRTCAESNAFGTCFGQQICDPDAGWSDCSASVPMAEVCDGVDNDCDGFADEEAVAPTDACETTWDDPVSGETAVCTGDWVCASSGGVTAWRCNAPQAGAEACDNRDNDCDGTVDEDFKLPGTNKYATYEHCGACGNTCEGAIPFGSARCDGDRTIPICVVEDCDSGYYAASETACLPVRDRSCTPCADDSGCPVTGDRCLRIDRADYCARDCGPDNVSGLPEGTCGEGFACVADSDGPGKHCVPETESCTCYAAEHAESRRSCFRTNDVGTCAGLQTCDPAAGWNECDAREPALEICNGVDDDCDGALDDDVVAPGPTCTVSNAAGTCTGDWRCLEQGGATDWRCSARTPATETCDYLDNDCDGRTDEDFRGSGGTGPYDRYDHCGLCGYSCDGTILFASETRCDASTGSARCVVVDCEDGYFQPEGLDQVCVPVGDVTDCSPCGEDAHCAGLPGACLLVDGRTVCGRNCAGPADCPGGFGCVSGHCLPTTGSCSCREGVDGHSRPCFDSNAYGTCTGVEACVPTLGWSACTAEVPRPEQCNGRDDDCDGLVDDGVVPPNEACVRANDEGICSGSWVCREGAGGLVNWQCTASTPAAETCNYRDDDCDGDTDEDFSDADTGAYFRADNCGVCGYSCVGLIEHATMACDVDRATPACVVAACDPGWYQQGDFACLPVTDDRCRVCETDANCPVPGDRCLDLDGGRYCGLDCSAGNLHGTAEGTCPEGYACVADAAAPSIRQCRPRSGSCTCLAGDSGRTRTCVRENAVGTCYGRETCDSAAGWGTCTALVPAVETCNGVDDDCDGFEDDVEGRGDACQVSATLPNGPHSCPGVRGCQAGSAALVCNAPTPTVERCNYRDDDCDGQTDEAFPQIYQSCSAGRGACQRFGFYDCKTDGSGTQCNAAAGTEGSETCNGIDDDCDGSTDETWPTKGQVCTVGRGICERNGVLVCDAANPGGPVVCSVQQGTSATEVCNALDDDCDGQTDENAAWATKGNVCTVGLGVCQRNGVFVCNAANPGGALVCSVQQGQVGAEVCNGQDDDCDGQTDENAAWANKGNVCTVGLGVCQRNGVLVCDAASPGGALVCSVQQGPVGTEVCNGLDDDCDGQTDEAWPTKGQACTVGRGICTRNGVLTCNPANRAGPVVCDATEGPANPQETCDYQDDDCDGQTDEGFLASGKYRTVADCGACGNDCNAYWIPNAAARHAVPRCDASGASPFCTFDCESLWIDADGVDENGCELYVDPAAIFVAKPTATNGAANVPGCGAWNAPCAGIQYGLDRAVATTGKTKVFVSDGAYEENVTLREGIALLGGFNHTSWARDPDLNVTSIFGEEGGSGHVTTVLAQNIRSRQTVLEGFRVYGRIADDPGANSYAIRVVDCDDDLVIRANYVFGGYGGSGTAGTVGADGTTGAPGGDGLDPWDSGQADCVAPVKRLGGAAGAGICGGASVSGGKGADSTCPLFRNDQQSAGAGAPNSGGSGGTGGYSSELSTYCSTCFTPLTLPPDSQALPRAGGNGTPGTAGSAGGGGAACATPGGSVAGDGHWRGGSGVTGAAGTYGRGGGGGGAGGGVNNDFPAGQCPTRGYDTLGATGGGGGAGGCGGTGGVGGASGGGVFTIFVWFTSAPTALPVIQDNTIRRGVGGPGGRGGDGGRGGTGGASGFGGPDGESVSSQVWCAGAGGAGGKGGDGGHGGGGGGGCGGSAYGIFVAGQGGQTPLWDLVNTFLTGGHGGAGGEGGAGRADNDGTAGQAGLLRDTSW